MHTVIRLYRGDPKGQAELARRIGESAREVITSVDGFVSYVFVVSGDGAAFSVGTFDDKTGADESTQRAAAWVRANALDLSMSLPTVLEGQTRARIGAPGAHPRYGVLHAYKVDPAAADAIVRRALEGFVPLISAAPGFTRYTMVAGGDGNIMTTSGFETREQAENSRVIKAAAEKVIELDPRNDLGWHVLGRWYFNMANVGAVKRTLAQLIYGKLPGATNEDAARCFEKAIELNPKRLMHYIELGRVYAEMGRTAEARKFLTKGLAMTETERDDPETKNKGREVLEKLR